MPTAPLYKPACFQVLLHFWLVYVLGQTIRYVVFSTHLHYLQLSLCNSVLHPPSPRETTMDTFPAPRRPETLSTSPGGLPRGSPADHPNEVVVDIIPLRTD
jgi:hypothetical protein